jgi:hypothetical protein
VGRRLVDLWFVCKLLGSEGSRRRGINTGSSEVTEVYARSPVSLVTWIERSQDHGEDSRPVLTERKFVSNNGLQKLHRSREIKRREIEAKIISG